MVTKLLGKIFLTLNVILVNTVALKVSFGCSFSCAFYAS